MAKTPTQPPKTKKTLKASAPKKAAVKKTPAKKAVSKPAAAKKVTAQKTVAKKATPKAPISKASVSKAPASKTPVSKKPTSLASVQLALADIDARLKKTERQTQKKVAALSTDFETLAKATKSQTAAQKGALTRRVNQLSDMLTRHMEANQKEVTDSLAQALNNPTLDSLQAAIENAYTALDRTEATQAQALSKINRNIADLAMAVDARLSEESAVRQAAMEAMKRAQSDMKAALETKITQASDGIETRLMVRLKEAESENATALSGLGDKVIHLAQDIHARAEDGEALIKERVNEIALNTQAEFEKFKQNLERRIETLEDNLRGTDSHIDRNLKSLTSRMEGLEYGMTVAPAAQAQTAQSQTAQSHAAPAYPDAPDMAASTDPAQEADAEQASAPQAAPADFYQQPSQHADPMVAPDAFSPHYTTDVSAPIAPPQTAPNYAQTPNSQQNGAGENPYAATHDNTGTGSVQAVPYDPAQYAAPQTAPSQSAPAAFEPEPYQAPQYHPPEYHPPQTHNMAPDAGAPQDYGTPPPPPPDTASHAGQAPYAGQAVAYVPPVTDVDLLPIEDGPLPYADPAYGEASAQSLVGGSSESMESARPGVFKSKKTKIPKIKKAGGTSVLAGLKDSPMMTPRNMRLGAVAAGLGVIALVASQTVLRPNAPADPFGAPMVASNDGPALPSGGDLAAPTNTAPQTVTTTPTIGQYADNQAVPITTGEGATALERAANAGNAVAQLQLGLSKLEAGDTAAGVALVRAAANQDQPAALYRLAKLYETGDGVTKDSVTARQLTERSARSGNRIAMHDLANYYVDGLGGVSQDMSQAAKWFQDAAQRGVVDSQYNLGIIFETGQGVDASPALAYYWYSIAAAQGDQTAAARIAILKDQLPADVIKDTESRVAKFKPTKIDPAANGIFENMPWSKAVQSVSNNAQVETITQTQTLLGSLGYDVGGADGAIGPKTRAAIISFERANGLPETGRVNAALLQRLELAAGV